MKKVLCILFLACIGLIVALPSFNAEKEEPFEGFFRLEDETLVEATSRNYFIWFHRSGLAQYGYLRPDGSLWYGTRNFHLDDNCLYLHFIPEWQYDTHDNINSPETAGMFTWIPPTIEGRREDGYCQIISEEKIKAIDEFVSMEGLLLVRTDPPKTAKDTSEPRMDWKSISFGVPNEPRVLKGLLYEAKPVAVFNSPEKVYPIDPEGPPIRELREYLQFVTGTYVYHGVLYKPKGKAYKRISGDPYFYRCYKNQLWIYIHDHKLGLVLFEKGIVSSDKKTIRLVSYDPDARIGIFPMDRTLYRSTRHIPDVPYLKSLRKNYGMIPKDR